MYPHICMKIDDCMIYTSREMELNAKFNRTQWSRKCWSQWPTFDITV